MRHVRFSLLLELEQRGVEEALSEIETERLAGIGVTGRCLPVPLVIAVAQVLQAGAARGVLFDLVSGHSRGAGQADHWYGDAVTRRHRKNRYGDTSNSKFEKGRGDVVRFRGDDKPKSQASKSNGALS